MGRVVSAEVVSHQRGCVLAHKMHHALRVSSGRGRPRVHIPEHAYAGARRGRWETGKGSATPARPETSNNATRSQ